MTGSVVTPRCPDCDQLPSLILADGHQCFCGTEGCQVLTWDSFLTPAENRAHSTVVDLTGLPGDHD